MNGQMKNRNRKKKENVDSSIVKIVTFGSLFLILLQWGYLYT